MIPWETIDQTGIPGQDGYLVLRKRGTEFSIRTAETELMNSRVHGSEDELARMACTRLTHKPDLKILIGGLGMGYTLAAALEEAGPDCLITVAELIPAVVTWNKKYLGHLAQNPLDDPRVRIKQEDVADIISAEKKSFDAILLDVDNGPEGLTRKTNDRLYTITGLKQAFQALHPGGILSVWSAGTDPAFTRRLNQCGFNTQLIGVRARKSGKGSRHTIWLARKPSP